MRTQRCSQCGSKLNISKLERGSKFACFNCGAILVVGQEPKAVKKSLSAGPVFLPKAKRATEEVAAVTASRRPAPPSAPRGKSKAPLMMGLAAVVIVGTVIAVMVGGGQSPGGGTTRGGTSGGKGRSQTASEWWSSTVGQIEAASASELRAFLNQASSRRFDKQGGWADMADEIYRALLKKEPDSAVANRHFGKQSLLDYPDFRRLWSRLNDNIRQLPKDAKALLGKYGDAVESGRKVWMDREEFEAAGETLTSFQAWIKRLESDPSIMQIEKGRMRARGELAKFDAGSAVARPFILLVGYRKDPGKTDEQRASRDALGARYASAIKVMTAEFEKRFREPLSLPALDMRTALYFWLFETKGDYDNFAQSRPLFGSRGDVLGGFSVKGRWSYATIPTDKAQAEFAGNNIAHTAAHQLQWHFSRDPKKKYLNYFEEWNGLWFTVGFAAWLGGGIEHDPGTGEARWTGIDPRRVAHLKHMKENGVPWVSLRELTQLESWQEFRRWIGDTWYAELDCDDDVNEGTLDLINQMGRGLYAVRLLYAQAWGLAHYLNEKYPQKYKDLLMTALRGKRKPQKYMTDRLHRWRNTYSAFAAIMGLKSDEDWEKLSRDYERHLKKLAR